MTFRELEKVIILKGWYHHHTNGSHYIYINIKKYHGALVIPNHKGDIPKGTLNQILKKAGVK